MASLSVVPSIRRTVVTLPSGDVCSKSQMAARQLLPLQRMPMSSPDMPVSANRYVRGAILFTLMIREFISDNMFICEVLILTPM